MPRIIMAVIDIVWTATVYLGLAYLTLSLAWLAAGGV